MYDGGQSSPLSCVRLCLLCSYYDPTMLQSVQITFYHYYSLVMASTTSVRTCTDTVTKGVKTLTRYILNKTNAAQSRKILSTLKNNEIL